MYRYNRSVSYEEFEGRVRRHRPSELLPAIARVAIELEERDARPQDERLLLPWALMATVKESVRGGAEYRSPGVTLRDVQEICGAFNALADPLLDHEREPELGALHSFFVRMAYEQFPHQLSLFEELARAYALFMKTLPLATTELIDHSFWPRILGCPLDVFEGTTFLLGVGAQKNGGRFDPAWLDQPNFAPIVTVIPKEVILWVFHEHFATSMEDFRREANEARSADPRLRRYDHNPLLARPFVRLPDGRYIAPLPQLVFRKATVSSLYYLGLRRLGTEAEKKAFTRDVGVLYQAYVGGQLGQLADVLLLPEVRYDGDQRSVDWFVVWPNMVLLVEAKSTRLTQPARMGTEALGADVERAIGKAFKQIERTASLVRERHRAFSHIPADREIVGLVATLEPYFLSNSPLIHQFLPTVSVPATIAAAREVERLVSIGLRQPLPPLLHEVLGDPDRRTWDISIALRDVEPDARNPLLDEAWRELPWTREAQKQARGE